MAEFDPVEVNGLITSWLQGRTIDKILRLDPELVIVTTCGHEITLQAAKNGNIYFKSQKAVIKVAI